MIDCPKAGENARIKPLIIALFQKNRSRDSSIKSNKDIKDDKRPIDAKNYFVAESQVFHKKGQ